ncbi:MAG: chemotaxis protein CheW [Spirochaetes bacterium DG_61]|nr:MAG: chemotaxis protein CheW [Spirochaetes bacterium DG_61]
MENQKHSHTLTRDQDQLISFVVGGEDYGIDIQRVKEVIRIREITKLPKCPVFVKGVINLRGDVIPIIDLREKFGLPHEEYTDMTRVIVVEVDEKSIGMVVDSVSHVIRLSEDEIEPPPPLIGGLSSEFIRGVGKLGENLIILLDIDSILTTEEKLELEQMEEPVLD